MSKIISLVSIIMFIGQISIAQSYKKAFKALHNKEYTSARVQFTQAQKNISTKAIGDYGVAVIQRATSMRTEDLYSAYKNIISAKKNWASCDESVKKKNKDYINEDIINKEFIGIDNQLFAKVKANGSKGAWQQFIDECPQSAHYSDAVKYRNSAAYIKALSFNTIPVWEEYIKQYPDAKEVKQAQENIYSIAWEKVSTNANIVNLELFISQYPHSTKIDEAKNLLLKMEYKRALAVNTEAAFESFIAKYPNTEQAAKLKMKAIENDYNNTLKFKEISLCNKFITKYPNSKYMARVVIIRDSLNFLAAQKDNTPKAYEDFIMNYPNAKQVPIAMDKIGKMLYSKEELSRLSKKKKIQNRGLKSLSIYQITDGDTNNKQLVEMKKYDIFGNCIYHFKRVTSNVKEVYKNNYDDAGDRLLKEQYFVNDKIKTINYNTYNINGQLINSQIVCNFDCIDSTADYSDTLIYNNKRELIEKIRRNSLGKIMEQHKYTYDNHGNIISEIQTVVNNDSTYHFTISYNYDSRGLLLQKTKLDQRDVVSYVISNSYDGLGRKISSSYYDKIGTVYYTFFYDTKGFVNSKTVKNEDSNGEIILKSYKYEYH